MSLIPQLLREFYEPYNSSNSYVAVDWKETPDAHVLKADLPGMKKDEVKVELLEDGKALQISGQRPVEKPGEENKNNEKWHRVERPRGEFLRRFYMPANARADGVKAAMENGVLIVTIPKQEIKKPEVKQIEITTN